MYSADILDKRGGKQRTAMQDLSVSGASEEVTRWNWIIQKDCGTWRL